MKDNTSNISIEFSIVMPCLNEAKTLAECIRKAQQSFRQLNINGEVIVADNGSNDGCPEIALSEGAEVVYIKEKGYGNALRGGISSARGRYILMGDADCSYDFSSISEFVEKLRDGYDLVMGNRFKGGILPGAMCPLHYYIGNPVLSGIGRLFFHSNIGDFHCGLRGFSRLAYDRIAPESEGMEFASELVVKASLLKLKTIEVPVVLYPDGRDRPPHLRSWSDGWRHLKLLLHYAPNWLFLYPAILMFILGVLFYIGAGFESLHTADFVSCRNSIFYSVLLLSLSFTLITFYLVVMVGNRHVALFQSQTLVKRVLGTLTIEGGLIFGGVLVISGLIACVYPSLFESAELSSEINANMFHLFILTGGLAIFIGIQLMLVGFLLRILGCSENKIHNYH